MNECTAKSPQRQPQVGEQVSNFGNNLDQLEKSVIALEERLAIVTAIELESDDKVGGAVPTVVPMADCLRNLNCRLSLLNLRLQSLHRRIEL